MASFLTAFPIVENNEGFYAHVPGDSGGETWIGIARNANPSWAGWPIVDSYKINGTWPGATYRDQVTYANKVLRPDATLQALVINFYENTEWHQIEGDSIQNDSIADFILDWGVNAGMTIPIKHLQQILGVDADGKIGPQTLQSLNASNQQNIFNALKAARIQFYHAVILAHPDYQKFLPEWLERTNSLVFKP